MILDVVFVCQQGELEVQAALLAASLHRTSNDCIRMHVIRPVPATVYGTPARSTVVFLDQLGVRWYEFANPISDEYKIGNKLNAFRIQPMGSRIIFLDSDMVARKSVSTIRPYLTLPFAARAAADQTFAQCDRDWERVYQVFGLALPKLQWPAIADGQWGRPYFNAGVLCVSPDLRLSDHWIETCRVLYRDERIDNKFPWLDQVALSVTLYRMGIAFRALPTIFNYPRFSAPKEAFNRRFATSDPVLVHYGESQYVLRNPAFLQEVRQLVRAYELEPIISAHAGWSDLLQHHERRRTNGTLQKIKRITEHWVPRRGFDRGRAGNGSGPGYPPRFTLSVRQSRRMLFITGIPRSGTSLIAQLLHQLPNIVVINEPRELLEVFRDPSLLDFYTTYLQWRAKIANGEPIENRWDGESIASNTWETGPRSSSVAIVGWANFVLGTKNPLAYLTRLRTIRRVFPGAKIVVMVRHPCSTIGSWKRTFPHLRHAKVIDSAVHHFADSDQREMLERLAGIQDESVRRAGLWDYLAKQIIEHAEPEMIIKYESLISDPHRYVREIYRAFYSGAVRAGIPQLSSRNHERSADIDEWDRTCIRTICADSAAAFGYHDL